MQLAVSQRITVTLEGLKADHPLGFLAACGVLRCCASFNEGNAVRLGWEKGATGRYVAQLEIVGDVEDPLGYIHAAIEHCRRKVASLQALAWSDKVDNAEKYRKVCKSALEQGEWEELYWLAAEATDAGSGRGRRTGGSFKGAELGKTQFDLTAGQQKFLKMIGELMASDVPLEKLRGTLLEEWRYEDSEHSLGWEPVTQRLQALHYRDPAKDRSNRSEKVAVMLAALALPLFPTVWTVNGAQTVGFHRAEGRWFFYWPIWKPAIGLESVRSLVSVVRPEATVEELKKRGIVQVYRSAVTPTGREGSYRVFSHAELVTAIE